MNRRTFMTSSSLVFAGLTVDKWSNVPPPFLGAKPSKLTILATNWGFQGSFADFCSAASQTGYDGVEVWLPDSSEVARYQEETKKYDLALGLLVGSGGKNPQEHLTSYRKALEEAIRLTPLYINCHAGKDHFNFDQNAPIIQAGIELAKQSQIPIYQETHRGRILYAASLSRDYFERFQDLRVTLDISHWCNVHESLLEDQKENVALALSRTGHIHARVGHAEGPQVTDPRAPEWQVAFLAHLDWWDEVISQKTKQNQPVTILTEFGPPDYMPVVPYTGQPLADNWKINAFMLDFLRKRYST